jgi:hypothetical protein
VARWHDGTPRLLPGSRCPHCGQRLNAVGVLGESPNDTPIPIPGDVTVCIGCGEVLTFDRRLRLKKATLAQLGDLEPDLAAELRNTQRRVRQSLAG